jgi:hypothetical protein
MYEKSEKSSIEQVTRIIHQANRIPLVDVFSVELVAILLSETYVLKLLYFHF